MTPRRIVRTLRIPLTESERDRKGSELAALVVRRVQLREQVAVLRNEIRELGRSIDQAGRVLANGYEERETECLEMADYRRGHVTVVRADTREPVEERAMTREERQMPLLDGGAA